MSVPEMGRAGAPSAPAPRDHVGIPTTPVGAKDSAERVPAEMLAPDNCRRYGWAIFTRSCPRCRHAHLFRSDAPAASFERTPPCGGGPYVLVVASVHLREAVA